MESSRELSQSPEERKQEVQKRFEAPHIAVNNYSGGQVNIISQLPATVKLNIRECQASPKGSYLRIIDLLTKLGFQILQAPNEDEQIVELLHGHLWRTNPNTGKTKERILVQMLICLHLSHNCQPTVIVVL